MPNTIKIGNRVIGQGQPTFVIAEAGINHNGSLRNAKRLIDSAVEAGVDCVKFQTRHLSEVYTKDILKNPNIGEQAFQYMIPIFKEFELSLSDYESLVKYCKEKDIIFSSTPFDKKSADFLEKHFDLSFYKIGSPDMTNFDLIEHVAKFKKPIIISTGMSSMEEVTATVSFLKKLKVNFALLHCSSTYPAPWDQLNLKLMDVFRKKYQVPVGYSGHELGIAVSAASVAMGASIVERHITLDRSMKGPDHAASLEPQGIKKLVRDIRNIEKSMGTGKKSMSRGEILNREVLSKSLVAARPIKEGSKIIRKDIDSKGPGKGLSPQKLYELVGTKAKRNFKLGEMFEEEDLSAWREPKPYLDYKTPWGLKARFNNIEVLLPYRPHFFEFHLTDKDLDMPFKPDKKFDLDLAAHAPEYNYRDILDLASLDEDDRKKAIKLTQKAIDKTNSLIKYFNNSKPKLVIHPGGMSIEKNTDPKIHQRMLDNFKKSVKELDFKDVEILPENLPPRPWYFGGQWIENAFCDLDDIIEVCRDLDLRMCLDTSHAVLYYNLTNKDYWEGMRAATKYVAHIHIADGYGTDGEGVQIGTGEIDFKKLGKYMKSIPHKDLTWVPEIWKGHQKDGRGFLVALEKLKPFIR